MAIGTLMGEQHFFMHDLESFFLCYSGHAFTAMGRTKARSFHDLMGGTM